MDKEHYMLLILLQYRIISRIKGCIDVYKRQIIVNVDAITEIATSFVPWIAACFGSEPRSIWVVTFSKTTIASSKMCIRDSSNTVN